MKQKNKKNKFRGNKEIKIKVEIKKYLNLTLVIQIIKIILQTKLERISYKGTFLIKKDIKIQKLNKEIKPYVQKKF